VAFEDKRLRDLVEADIRQLIDAGVAEHLYLEYKAEVYGENLAGRKEFLLDVCMLANAQGGLLLVGVPEQRDPQDQPTGIPNPAAQLGLQVDNPEALLLSYDARVVSCVEERLSVESFAIPIAGGRHVLAFRIPDSVAKPHCVRLEGHVYFVSRRERHRYHMDVREIKDLSVRLMSQLERAEALVAKNLEVSAYPNEPAVFAALVPLFFKNFLVDVGEQTIRQAFGNFHMSSSQSVYAAPEYTVNGLRRVSARNTVELNRNGAIVLRASIGTGVGAPAGQFNFYATAIDVILRRLMRRAQGFCSVAKIPAPMLLGISIVTSQNLAAMYAEGVVEAQIDAGVHRLPVLEIGSLTETVEKIIKPLCDVAHQMFGQSGSPCFGADGSWQGPPG
jgi:hypothetical protein